jgi:hypothetical protein
LFTGFLTGICFYELASTGFRKKIEGQENNGEGIKGIGTSFFFLSKNRKGIP